MSIHPLFTMLVVRKLKVRLPLTAGRTCLLHSSGICNLSAAAFGGGANSQVGYIDSGRNFPANALVVRADDGSLSEDRALALRSMGLRMQKIGSSRSPVEHQSSSCSARSPAT